jgi:carbonic anhydrase
MAALHDGIDGATNPNLAEWLRLGMPALDEACFPPSVGEERTPRDATSQRNVLQQLRHVRTYPFVAEALDAGRLRLHGWWFDIEEPVVRAFHESSQRFLPIELAYAQSDFG